MRRTHLLLWLPALLLTSADALAWGLYTHVYFAQALVWLVPLADPCLRAAARRLPGLVLAGACLPDLALTDLRAERPVFEHSHEWETAARLLAAAGSEEERALALGFASHLFTDIFAHNHFVPAHEIVWFDAPVLTHAACEWAMDHHVRRHVYGAPAELLAADREVVAAWVAAAFGCTPGVAGRALDGLAGADRLLRRSGLPRLAHGVGGLGDRRMARRFAHYLSHTVRHLRQMDRIAAGERPQWVANPCRHAAREALAGVPARLLRARLPMPADLFRPAAGRSAG